MNIREIITSTLDSTNLYTYFIVKPNDEASKQVTEYLTFNYTKSNQWYSNNKNEIEVYSVTINHVSKNISDVATKQETIENILTLNEKITNVRYLQAVFNNETNEYIGIYTCSVYL